MGSGGASSEAMFARSQMVRLAGAEQDDVEPGLDATSKREVLVFALDRLKL